MQKHRVGEGNAWIWAAMLALAASVPVLALDVNEVVRKVQERYDATHHLTAAVTLTRTDVAHPTCTHHPLFV